MWPAGYRYPDPVAQSLTFLAVPDTKTVKDRMHLDVAPDKGEDLAAAVRLLREAGAVPADAGRRDVTWEVLADPEGNEFCVLPALRTLPLSAPSSGVALTLTRAVPMPCWILPSATAARSVALLRTLVAHQRWYPPARRLA